MNCNIYSKILSIIYEESDFVYQHSNGHSLIICAIKLPIMDTYISEYVLYLITWSKLCSRRHRSHISPTHRTNTIRLRCTKNCWPCRRLQRPQRLPRQPTSHKWEVTAVAAAAEAAANPKSLTIRISNNTTAARRILPCLRCQTIRHRRLQPATITTRARTIRTTAHWSTVWVSQISLPTQFHPLISTKIDSWCRLVGGKRFNDNERAQLVVAIRQFERAQLSARNAGCDERTRRLVGSGRCQPARIGEIEGLYSHGYFEVSTILKLL